MENSNMVSNLKRFTEALISLASFNPQEESCNYSGFEIVTYVALILFVFVVLFIFLFVYRKKKTVVCVNRKKKKNKKTRNSKTRIGKMVVSRTIIGTGNKGTLILEGSFHDRPVAVKKLVKLPGFAEEWRNTLIPSDQHANIVRLHGYEEDKDFFYLALERCVCNLEEFIKFYSDDYEEHYPLYMRLMELTNNKTIQLWKDNGKPTPALLKVMSGIVRGVHHLHQRNIMHRGLKPQNILMDETLNAKISDMGIGKFLSGDRSSVTHATGEGTPGWQHKQQLLHEHEILAGDLFSLGCVLFFCYTKGHHPYGDNDVERDLNISNDEKKLDLVNRIPEAKDLFIRLLDVDPYKRPKAIDVLLHPLFWDSETIMSFFMLVFHRIEDKNTTSQLKNDIENIRPSLFDKEWYENMGDELRQSLQSHRRYRKFNFQSVIDLLRLIRNKSSHYRDPDVQQHFGSSREEFVDFFTKLFPNLLIEVYRVMYSHCSEEKDFHKYFKDSNL